ncbi:hypothetical protein F5I97DRAFT_1270746 [Phlebopus sp. FC_14]|nr:hypothetical protein F5I97DRAFT_1270746 [Phlebopus sp. FC_14]
MNIELSIIKAELPAFTNDWSRCFVQINVDGSPSAAKTGSTKRPGHFEWGDRLSLPARSETILRFELKRKILLRQPQLLASAEAPVSELLNRTGSGQGCNIPLQLKPLPSKHVTRDSSKGSADWHLIICLHADGDLVEEMKYTTDGFAECFAEIATKLEVFIQIGDAVAQIHPYINVAWKTVTSFYSIIKGQVDRDSRLRDLVSLMRDCYGFVENVKAFPEKMPVLEEIVHRLLSQTVECTMFIRECSGHGFGERLMHSAWMDRQINFFTQSFTLLRQSLDSGVSMQTTFVCFRIDESVKQLVSAQNLMKLSPADMDDALRSECLPETRMDIITKIFEWAATPVIKNNVFWLRGFPGAGKSTIATSVANIFRNLRRLGSFVFFTRGVAARNDPALLIRTLAYQLGEFDHRISNAISKVIEDTPSIKQAPLRWQFQKLLVEPFTAMEHCLREGPILIVIDALDECGRPGARDELLRVLASESFRLPPTLRIFITSRAERDIHCVFSSHSHILAHEIDIASPANEHDVRTYIHHRMTDIRRQNAFLSLPPDWPGASRVNALALRASGLFVWASTACRYIENSQDPEERLEQLVQLDLYADAEAALDGIYTTALECAGKWEDFAFAADFREILGIVIVAENPLTAQTIDLLNADISSTKKKRPCLHTIHHLGAVLQWAVDRPICVMHPSFADFITERRRCGADSPWYIDKRFHHLRLARQCMRRLGAVLKKNMCEMTLSTSFETQELQEDVTYAAKCWINHLCEVQCSEAYFSEEIGNFLRTHFLHWVEVMAVMKKARQTIGLMVSLKEWIDTNYVHESALRSFVKDAVRFCQAYTHLYEQHPLLVYQGALPFSPTASLVFRTFKDDPDAPYIAGGFREHWSPLLTEFGRPGGNVISLSCSSDGQHIVSTNTRNIYVWDSTSGELVTKTIIGNQNNVTVVAFSPNNQHFASGYKDGSIRLWDTLAGKEIIPPMMGHAGAVYGLVFSGDGKWMVSASQDKHVVIWDAATGQMVHGPLEGHTKTVLCLAFSPSSNRFVSGSRDRSIRTWDATSGREVLPPIIYRASAINALAYTPDGSRIVSASEDRTICVWDARTGTLLRHPCTRHDIQPFILHGHKSSIYSVAVSPDGTLIASGSKDTSVRIWDVATGSEVSHLVRQHRLPVRCVVFSPDGRRIITGSQDATVRVWDLESVGSMGARRLHKGLVSHVAFSGDGRRVISGGFDRTVRIWCSETGRALIEPLLLEKEVHSAVFSPDDKRILAVDKEGAIFAWDAVTREALMATPEDNPSQFVTEGPLILDGRWIRDTRTDRVVCALPNMSPAKARASRGNTIAIGFANGSIVILHFPGLGRG